MADGEEAALFEALVDVGGDSVGRRINKRSLGKYLAKNKDRIVNGMCLRAGPLRQRYATWWVESVDGELGELSEFVSATPKMVTKIKSAQPTTVQQAHETHKTHKTHTEGRSKPAAK